jgi:hypothetical protein
VVVIDQVVKNLGEIWGAKVEEDREGQLLLQQMEKAKLTLTTILMEMEEQYPKKYEEFNYDELRENRKKRARLE